MKNLNYFVICLITVQMCRKQIKEANSRPILRYGFPLKQGVIFYYWGLIIKGVHFLISSLE